MRLDNLRPNVEMRYKDQLFKQACDSLDKHRKSSQLREFSEGDSVLVRNYLGKQKWVPGKVVSRDGPVSYTVQVESGKWRRHIEQIRSRIETEEKIGQSQRDRLDFGETHPWSRQV